MEKPEYTIYFLAFLILRLCENNVETCEEIFKGYKFSSFSVGKAVIKMWKQCG